MRQDRENSIDPEALAGAGKAQGPGARRFCSILCRPVLTFYRENRLLLELKAALRAAQLKQSSSEILEAISLRL